MKQSINQSLIFNVIYRGFHVTNSIKSVFSGVTLLAGYWE